MLDSMMDRRRLIGATIALSAVPALARAQPAADLLATAFVAAINEPLARKPFIAVHASEAGLKARPEAEWLEMMDKIRTTSGGVDFVRSWTGANSVRIRVKTRRQSFERDLVLFLDPKAPGKVSSLNIRPRPVRYDPGVPDKPMTREALRDAIAARVKFATDRDEFSGAIRILTPDGQVFLEAAHGIANRDTGTPIKTTDRFHLASADKSFTALLIGRLIDAGKLTLDTKIIEVLPAYANRDAAAKITVRHLLSHSAGLGMLFERKGYDKHKPNTTVTELLPYFWAEAPRYEPGTSSGYSNEGFLVLGAMVETLTGQTWYDQLAKHIYAPSGMTRSGHFTLDETVPGRAVGYLYGDDDIIGVGERQPNWAFQGYRGNSCGGGYSTVADMTAYLRALRAGKLVPATLVDLMTTQIVGGYGEYGLGFQVRAISGRKTYGHSGGGPGSGIDGDSWIVKETGWACSILGNYDSPFVKDLSRDIAIMVAAQEA